MQIDLSEAKREVEALKKRILDDNKAYGCELHDPNGTIWEYADSLRAHLNTANEHLHRVTDELAELIKGEQDDKDVGITGWNALHESVAAARTHLNQQNK